MANCPLLMMAVVAERECLKEKCQWWSEGNCIVHGFKRLLVLMDYLNSEIFKGSEKICSSLLATRRQL